MSTEHDCNACKGIKYDGANVTCIKCLRPWYLECLASRSEVTELMSHYNKATTGTRTQTKIRALFGQQSVFCFLCPKCKSEGSVFESIDKTHKEYSEYIKKSESSFSELLAKFTVESNKVKSLEEQILIQKTEKEEYVKENTALIHNIGELEKRNTNRDDENRMDTNDNDNSLSTQLQGIYTNLSSQLNEQFGVLAADIEARIILECNKINNTMQFSPTPVNGNSQKRRRQHLNNNNNVISINNKNKENGGIEFNNINGLRPPQNQQIFDNKSVYEIHVSKFHTATTPEDIEKHVVDKTKCKSESFKVEQLISRRNNDRNRNYISFKITTLSANIYEQILDQNIWIPHFTARDFEPMNIGEITKRNQANKKQFNQLHKFKNSSRNKNDLRRNIFDKNMIGRYNNNSNKYRSYDNRSVESTPKRLITPKKRAVIMNQKHPHMNNYTLQPVQQMQPIYYYHPHQINSQNQNFLTNSQHQVHQQQQQQQMQN